MVSRRKFVAGSVALPLLASIPVSARAAQDSNQAPLQVLAGESAYTQATIEGFVTAYPDINFEYVGGSLNFEDGSLQARLQSGVGPDVLLVGSGPGRIGAIASGGLIMSLDELYQAPSMDVYLPGVIDQLQNQSVDGQIYEVVEGLDVFQIYYNTEIFDDNGLQPPETWEDFLAICRSLSDAGVQPLLQGIRDSSSEGWVGGTLIQASAGRDVMTDVIYGDGDFTHPDILRAFEILAMLVEERYLNGLEAAALTNDQATAAFANGGGAMTVQPQGFPINLGNDGVDTSNVQAFLLPSLNEGQPPAPTAGLAISWIVNADTDNREAAEAWLQWVASDEYLRLATESGGWRLVPARVVPDGITLPAPIQDASKKLAGGAGYNPSVYLPPAAKDAWFAACEQLFTNQATPQEAIDLVQAGLEEDRANS